MAPLVLMLFFLRPPYIMIKGKVIATSQRTGLEESDSTKQGLIEIVKMPYKNDKDLQQNLTFLNQVV